MIFEASEAVGVPKLTISTSELSVSSDDNDVVPDVYLPRQHVVPAVSSFAKDVTNPLVSNPLCCPNYLANLSMQLWSSFL